MTAPPIVTRRLSLVVLDATVLALMASGGSPRPFRWPAWWPDDEDRKHLAHWQRVAAAPDQLPGWGPRAILDEHREMVGHAGFHRSPETLAVALADETFVGTRAPDSDAAVEIGYTIFPEHRGNGYATEAVTGLLDWAAPRVGAITVLASVAVGNQASLRVLERIGGFVPIGTCTDDGTPEQVFRRDVGRPPRSDASDLSVGS